MRGPLKFQIRLAADPAAPQRLYMTWLDAREVGLFKFTAAGDPLRAARSDDGGRTWSQPVDLNSPTRTRAVAPTPAIGPQGQLYVLYLRGRFLRAQVVKAQTTAAIVAGGEPTILRSWADPDKPASRTQAFGARTGTTIPVTIAAMSNGFSVGDRVMRVNDGAVGVVATMGPGGDIGVRWEPSGVIQMVVPTLLKRA